MNIACGNLLLYKMGRRDFLCENHLEEHD